jgi:hypothetical protein
VTYPAATSFRILGVYASSQVVSIFLTTPGDSNYEQYTVEIKELSAFVDSQLDPPARIRFGYYLDGTVSVGGAGGQVRKVLASRLQGFVPFVPLEMLAIALSLAVLFVAVYSTVQRRQSIYPLMPLASFTQVLFWLAFVESQPGHGTSFLVGFRFALIKFFPNFFMAQVPDSLTDLISGPRFQALTVDSNMVRNAGETYSLWLILIAAVAFYYLVHQCLYLELILDYPRKATAAISTLFMFSWPNAFFFSFADFYSKQDVITR